MRLSGNAVPVSWHRSIEEVPEGPLIVLANEFFDALPIHQAVMCADGWHERVIKIGEDDKLHFSIARDPIPLFDELLPSGLHNAKIGEIFEWREDKIALELGRRVAHFGGAALIIDYGHAKSAIGDTLQAVSGHAFADPLDRRRARPISPRMWTFRRWRRPPKACGARVHGPLGQGEFLRRLGIEQRAAALKAGAPPEYAAAIEAALARLTNEDRTGMGRMIKAFAAGRPQARGPARLRNLSD